MSFGERAKRSRLGILAAWRSAFRRGFRARRGDADARAGLSHGAVRLLVGASAFAVAAASTPAAQACGGCFSPPSSNAPVVGHRMAFALSQERTVLWDQFEYAGSPEEFSWVLPVARGAYLEASNDAFFEALEAYTQVVVSPPPLNCSTRGDDSGCGVSSDLARSDLTSEGSSVPSVSVIRRATVGPYDTVTLRSRSGDALSGWLVDNGYVIPDDIRPIIAAYVSEGADFIALRLRPGAGVSQMTPVRVVTPGGTPILPLRMVAAGVGDAVDIVLYVIGERRYAMPDLLEVKADLTELSFDFAAGTSNYLELRRRALARNDGHVFLTAYAGVGDFGRAGNVGLGGNRQTGRGWSTTSGSTTATDLVSLYFKQALENSGATDVTACDAVAERTRTDRRVVPGCGASAAEDGAADAGALGEQPECPPPGADELAASELTCRGFDDIGAVLLGQRPSTTWLTRLELRLPRAALSIDCVVEPNFDPSSVSSALSAQRFSNPPCDLPVFSSSLTGGESPLHAAHWLAAALLGIVARRMVKRGA